MKKSMLILTLIVAALWYDDEPVQRVQLFG